MKQRIRAAFLASLLLIGQLVPGVVAQAEPCAAGPAACGEHAPDGSACGPGSCACHCACPCTHLPALGFTGTRLPAVPPAATAPAVSPGPAFDPPILEVLRPPS